MSANSVGLTRASLNLSCVDITSDEWQLTMADASLGVENLGSMVFGATEGVIVETVVIGVYSFLILLSTFILLRKGFKTFSRAAVAVACLIMYSMSVTHWAGNIRYYYLNIGYTMELRNSIFNCLRSVRGGELGCRHTMDQMLTDNPINNGSPVLDSSCLKTAELLVTIVLSDMIVVWRAWVLWSRNRVVQGVSVVFVLLTLVMSALSAQDSCVNTFDNIPFVQQNDTFGFLAFIFSWCTNLWATGLITYKAWRYRRLIKKDVLAGSFRTRLEKTLLLFVDCGFLYCALWTLLVANTATYEFGLWPGGNLRFPAKWQIMAVFTTSMNQFLDTALIEVIGIYPTLLVVLVALAKSNIDRTLVSTTPSPPNSEPTARAVATNRANTTSSSENPRKVTAIHNLLGETVIALGHDQLGFDSSSEYSRHDEEGQLTQV